MMVFRNSVLGCGGGRPSGGRQGCRRLVNPGLSHRYHGAAPCVVEGALHGRGEPQTVSAGELSSPCHPSVRLRSYTAEVVSLRFFNWKIGLTSAVFRGVMFFATTAGAGWRTALSAALVEAAYRGIVSGLEGALLEAVAPLVPVWLAGLLASFAISAAVIGVEYAIHAARGTPNLNASTAVSLATTSLFTLFNWFAMGRGLLLTGARRASLRDDLRRVPGVAWDFLLAGPRTARRFVRRECCPGAPAGVTKTSRSVQSHVTTGD